VKNMLYRLFAASLLVLVLFNAAPAVADEYETPSLQNFVKTLVRFGALNINDNDIINEYAMIEECKIYNHFTSDDFKWHQIQAALRESIHQNVKTFPTGYHYDKQIQLGHYDFKEKLYRFNDEKALSNVNSFTISTHKETACQENENSIFPKKYKLVLDHPLYIPGLPLAEEDARTLLKHMEENKNEDHIIMVRFNLKIIYILPLVRKTNADKVPVGELHQATNTSNTEKASIRFDSRIGSVDFFEDESMTKLIYSFRP